MGLFGSVLGYLGARKAAKAQESAARSYADASRFRPYNVRGNVGSGMFDGETGTATLNPEYQRFADLYNQLGYDQLSQVKSFDPQEYSQDFYDRLSTLSQPSEDQSRLDLEERLFSQGMLGSSGGMQRQKALEDAIAENQLRRELAAINASEGMLDNMINRGTALNQAAVNLSNVPVDLLNLGGSFGRANTLSRMEGQRAISTALTNNAANQALFWQQLGGTIDDSIQRKNPGEPPPNPYTQSSYYPPIQS